MPLGVLGALLAATLRGHGERRVLPGRPADHRWACRPRTPS
ncbi:hypothetical protein ACU4GD_02965 [Cupriavidus basilensis]